MGQVAAQAAEIGGNVPAASAQSQANVDAAFARELAQVRANGNAQEIAALETIIANEKAIIRLKFEQAQIAQQNSTVNTQLALLEQQKQNGLITQIDYENQLNMLKRQELQTQISIKEATDLTGLSEEARIEHARQLAILRGQLSIAANREQTLVQQTAVKMGDSLADAFAQIAGGLQSSEQAFGSWKRTVLSMIGQVIAKMLITKTLAAFGIGTPEKKAKGGEIAVSRAEGGVIDVPGKSRSGVADDIVVPIAGTRGKLAAVSNGEFIVNKRSTDLFRPLLEKINSIKTGAAIGNVKSTITSSMQKLATGGVVGMAAAAPAMASPQVTIINNSRQPVQAEAKLTRDNLQQQVLQIVLTDLNSNGQTASSVRNIANNTR
jgi:hypothetical protein